MKDRLDKAGLRECLWGTVLVKLIDVETPILIVASVTPWVSPELWRHGEMERGTARMHSPSLCCDHVTS